MSTSPRIYHLVIINNDGSKVYLTSCPMSHEQCMVMKSKFTNTAIIAVEEVKQ